MTLTVSVQLFLNVKMVFFTNIHEEKKIKRSIKKRRKTIFITFQCHDSMKISVPRFYEDFSATILWRFQCHDSMKSVERSLHLIFEISV